jgi:hypothetical protein
MEKKWMGMPTNAGNPLSASGKPVPDRHRRWNPARPPALIFIEMYCLVFGDFEEDEGALW